jgi:YD repeat-containing protein
MLGHLSSAMEHLVWEELTNIRCMSTIKSLQLARERGIPVFEVTKDNWSTYGPQLNQNQSAWVCAKVYDAVQQGATVTIPRNPTPLGDWGGVGYIVEYASGGASYMISGDLNTSSEILEGGATTGNPLGVLAAAINSLVQTWAGDPINTANGSVCQDETDLVFPGLGSPLEFSRHYHSAHTGSNVGFASDRGLSDGWSFTCSDRLETHGDDRIWFTDSGDRLIFKTDGAGGFITPNSIYGTLVNNGVGSGYTWTDKTGAVTDFDDSGRLVQREDRFGSGISVSYDVSGHIQQVADLQSAGRRLDFTYTGDHITSISDFTGRSWAYQYDANGRLWKMTAPSDASTPVAIVEYEYYTDAIRDGLLKRVVDPNGEETTFTYYANRRGFEVTGPSGHTQMVTYNLFRTRTAFTDERGFTTYYTVDGVQVEPIARLDFGSSTSPVATGYTRVTGADVYTGARGYGWLEPVARPKGDRRIYWAECVKWPVMPVLFEGGRDDAESIADAVAPMFVRSKPYCRARLARRTQRRMAASSASV